ncbi:hypothetical protein B0J14DRAFT_689531 [Halenospora varia]|nr:hypothetical protein B0J14DRAFT_689531 [Halenospora varia]
MAFPTGDSILTPDFDIPLLQASIPSDLEAIQNPQPVHLHPSTPQFTYPSPNHKPSPIQFAIDWQAMVLSQFQQAKEADAEGEVKSMWYKDFLCHYPEDSSDADVDKGELGDEIEWLSLPDFDSEDGEEIELLSQPDSDSDEEAEEEDWDNLVSSLQRTTQEIAWRLAHLEAYFHRRISHSLTQDLVNLHAWSKEVEARFLRLERMGGIEKETEKEKEGYVHATKWSIEVKDGVWEDLTVRATWGIEVDKRLTRLEEKMEKDNLLDWGWRPWSVVRAEKERAWESENRPE